MSALYIPMRRTMYLTLGMVNNIVKLKNKNIFILCYHSISNDGWAFAVSLQNFKKQINYLKDKYQFITLSDLLDYINGKKNIDKPSVVLTFDDGYKDVLQTVSFLKNKKIKPTMFLLSDIKHANRKELATNRAFLNKGELKSLIKNGWELGSHTATHANMNTLNNKEIIDEIINSKKTLEKELNISIQYLAYPKGKYNEKILSAVKKAKYKMALTMDDGNIQKGINIYRIPRIGVDGTHSFSEFKNLFLPLNIKAREIIKSVFYKQK